MQRARLRLSAVVLGCLVLGGCSGSANKKVPAASAPTSTTAAAPGPTTPTTAAPTSSSQSTAAPVTTAIARCTTADLDLRSNGGSAATGHALAVFELRNTSSKPCRLLGYPGVRALDASGATLADAQRTAGFILGDVAPAAVTVPAGQVAYFGVESTNVCQGGQNPTPSATLRVTPPDETAALTVTATINVCRGAQSVLVSPIRATAADITRR